MSPPNAASSFMELDFTITYFASVGMKSVSMFESKLWFISERSNSYAKSFVFLIPLSNMFALFFSAYSTISLSQRWTVTFLYLLVSSLSILMRSSGVKSDFFSGLHATTTSILSKRRLARSITFRCPYVGGSKDPGKTADVIMHKKITCLTDYLK